MADEVYGLRFPMAQDCTRPQCVHLQGRLAAVTAELESQRTKYIALLENIAATASQGPSSASTSNPDAQSPHPPRKEGVTFSIPRHIGTYAAWPQQNQLFGFFSGICTSLMISIDETHYMVGML